MSNVPRARPRLMVIGDSLAQGCRSLSVKRSFCAQSWPARVAAAQGWEFLTPDFPRPVLFDLEEEIRRLDAAVFSIEELQFRGLEGRVRQNLAEWLIGAPESPAPCFDNLALSGAEVHDLYTRTAATSAATLAELTPQGVASAVPLARIGDLHLAINARFTLNPSRNPAFAGFTPLDWVRERKPETLVMQIGHNHGLYAVGSEARDVPIDGGHPVHGDFWAQWERLASELAGLPAEVGTILVCLLPKVGAVANLRPRGADRAGGYAETYEPVFSAATSVLSGTALAAIDDRVRAANARIRQVVGGAASAAGTDARLKFVDTFALFEGHDFKNTLDPARRVGIGPGVVADNRYLDGAPNLPRPFGPGGRRVIAGGFLSADGMHPSGCGYALLASEAMAALGLPHDRAALLRAGFADDPLLSQTPGELDILVRLLGILQDLLRLNQFLVDRQTFLTDRLHLADAIRFMHQVFMR